MRLLALISWPYARRHALRTLLTATGVVLGIAVFVGMHTANQRVLEAFSDTIDRIAGKTDLQITAGDAGIAEEVLEQVQALPSVRVAVPVIEAVVRSQLQGESDLMVVAVDMTGDRSLRDYDLGGDQDEVLDDPLIFLAQPDSLILTRDFADRHGLKVKSTVNLETAAGDKPFTVRGIMQPKGLATAFGGNLAVMDVYAAQHMFGRGRTFDRIDVAVKSGVAVAEGQHAIEAALGPGFDVQLPSTRGQQAQALVSGYGTVVNLSSAFALFVGMFIVHSSFSTAVTQRRKEIGLLRALGATRHQVRNLFLAESLAVGVVGSLVGVATGVLVAGAITAAFARLAAELYGLAQQPPHTAADFRLLALAAATGAFTSVAATLLPAIRAAGIQPTEALQQTVTAGQAQDSWRRPIIGAALAATAGVLMSAGGPRVLSYLAYVLTVVAALLAGPWLARALVFALRPVLKWWRPIEGALAGDSLLVSERTSGAILALTFSLALAIAFAGAARAAYGSVVQWLDSTMNADLFVLPSQRLELHAMRFPPDMAAEIASIPGVARVQTYRSSRATFRGKPVMVAALEMKSVRDTARQRPVAGSLETMYETAAAGQGVLVSDNLAQSQALQLGDSIELPAPAGTIRLPIVGILADYTDQQGTIFVDRSVFLTFWRDDMASDFRVFVAPGADPARVRQAIGERFSGRRHVFVMTNGDARQYVLGTANRWFQLIDLQVGIAVLVAILGIVNALTVSITDRRRELGVLKAVGALRGQIRRTIWLEAAGVAVIGLILGMTLGAVLLRYLLDIVQRDAAGLRLDYRYPFGTAALLVPVMLAAAIAAAIWPSQVAVRGSLVEALEYE